MLFSRRADALHEPPNALGRAAARARARGNVLDLTVSNPTAAGLPYAGEAILRAIATPASLVYAPEALGLPSARAVVAAEYGIAPAHVAITSSTSEAYAVLFKLLCDPGEEVLVPVPSYPLLAWLAAFEGVKLVTYPLVYAGGWHVDVGALAAAVTPRTKAIVVVSPNNPTGSYLGREELAAMLALGLPMIVDEVFATYPLGTIPEHRVRSVLEARTGLVFRLSGLSKLVGLPQLKLGWIACGGDPALLPGTIERLETVLDAYLSVGAPVQHALPALLAAGRLTADAIRARIRANLRIVRARCAGTLVTVLDVEGGWSAILRVPETETDEEWALWLLEQDSVLVQPGYFFDLTRGAHLVVSLLTPEADLAAGIERIVARVSAS